MNVRVILALCLSMLAACSVRKIDKPEEPLESVKEFTVSGLYDTQQPGCKGMLDAYCNYLYSPEISGNLRVKDSREPLWVLQGHTKNDFSVVYYEYAKAKLRNREEYPKDFLESLEARNYFDRLRSFLGRKPREQMALAERLRAVRMESSLENAWESSITETVLKRMEQKFRGFHQIKESLIPVELQVENKRMRRRLISEISKATWKRHPNWVKVEKSFQTLQQHFVSVLNRLDIPEPIRRQWIQRVESVRLVLPGASLETSDDECSTTQINAAYYPYLNIMTVCAGDFNSEDILETMAHELGHSLDLQRSEYLFQKGSELGHEMTELRTDVCKPETFSCPTWAHFKEKFPALLSELKDYRPELNDFQRCLKRHPTKPFGDQDLQRVATTEVTDRLAELAENEIFLRITKQSIPLPNGKSQANPNYLNPCSYYLWSKGEEPVDDEITSLLFFTAEYRCGAGTPAEKMRNAMQVSKTLSVQLTREVIRMEGEFSSRKLMDVEGYSSFPGERFADVMGSYALAETLRDNASIRDRRNIFLASSSWQCNKPSLATSFPEESAVEQEFMFDAHTDGDARKKELFTLPVREALGCRKDYSFEACELNLRKN